MMGPFLKLRQCAGRCDIRKRRNINGWIMPELATAGKIDGYQ